MSKKVNLPSDNGVDVFEPMERKDIPEYVSWLHRQAKLGLANKYTPTQAGFKIGEGDVSIVPDLEGILGVVLGYKRG